MKKLSWDKFDGDRFQEFCNALVCWHVSKFAHVYSAPGKDGGIDQYYVGAFEGKEGKWRFQDKFRSGDKAKALAQLKRDIRADIREHYKDEDFIVFLINVNLNPKQKEELQRLAMVELQKLGGSAVEIIVWHGGYLDAQLPRYPLLFNWFFQTEAPVLEDYKTFFQPYLRRADLRSQLWNNFVGRQGHLDTLREFLTGPLDTLLISGKGGMGKTRLVLHFLQTVIECEADWMAVVLKPSGFSAASFGNLLDSERKLVILVDDIHKHSNLFADIRAEAEKRKGRVKCIFTVRENMRDATINQLPGVDQNMQRISLKELLPAETKDMYRQLLPLMADSNIFYLAAKAQGWPSLILGHCEIIRRGGHPDEIGQEEGYRLFVEQTVKEAIDFVQVRRDIDRRVIRRCIELIPLIGPIPRERASALFADLLGEQPSVIDEVLQALKAFDLLEGGDKVAITPDPLSDTILSMAVAETPGWIAELLTRPSVRLFTKQIMTNIAVSGLLSGNGENVVEQVFDQYLTGVRNPETKESELVDILEVAAKLNFRYRAKVLSTVRLFLDNVATRATSFQDYTYRQVNTLLLPLTLQASDDTQLSECYVVMERFVDLTGRTDIVHGCFGFREFDFEWSIYGSRPCCERQLWLLNEIGSYFVAVVDRNRSIALAAFDSLWVHDLLLEQSFDKDTGQFSYGEMLIRDCGHIRELRGLLLKGILAFLLSGWATPEEEKKYLETVSRSLLYMFNFPKKKDLLDERAEVATIIAWLRSRWVSLPPVQRAVVNRMLSLGLRREVKPEYVAAWEALQKEATTVATMYERLELFLLTVTYSEESNNRQAAEIVQEYENIGACLHDLMGILKIHTVSGNSSLHALLLYIGKRYGTWAKAFFIRVVEEIPHYIPQFSVWADELYSDRVYFKGLIDRIWDLPDYRSTAIAMLVLGERGRKGMLREDLVYFPQVIEEGNHMCRWFLASSLYRYARLAVVETFALLEKLVAKEGGEVVEKAIYEICTDADFCPEFKDEVLQFVLVCFEKESPFRLTVESALRFIHRFYGLERLFVFVVAAVDQARTKFQFERGYRYENGSGDVIEVAADFKRWLDWVAEKGKDWDTGKKSWVLHFFLPCRHDDLPPFFKVLKVWIDKSDDADWLRLLALAMQGYTPYGIEVLTLQADIAEKLLIIQPGCAEMAVVFGDRFMENRETGKSGVWGQPSWEDQGKAKVLETVLSNRDWRAEIQFYLENALATVRKEMCEHTGSAM
jgi:hypothetical protein